MPSSPGKPVRWIGLPGGVDGGRGVGPLVVVVRRADAGDGPRATVVTPARMAAAVEGERHCVSSRSREHLLDARLDAAVDEVDVVGEGGDEERAGAHLAGAASRRTTPYSRGIGHVAEPARIRRGAGPGHAEPARPRAQRAAGGDADRDGLRRPAPWTVAGADGAVELARDLYGTRSLRLLADASAPAVVRPSRSAFAISRSDARKARWSSVEADDDGRLRQAPNTVGTPHPASRSERMARASVSAINAAARRPCGRAEARRRSCRRAGPRRQYRIASASVVSRRRAARRRGPSTR